MTETLNIIQLLITGLAALAMFFMGVSMKNLSDSIKEIRSDISSVRDDFLEHVSNHSIHSTR